jgi:IS5 family transposase
VAFHCRRPHQLVRWLKARIRAKVEHPFRVIKRQFGRLKVRYRGLMKNTQQLHTLFALSNLWMARRRILQEAKACMRPEAERIISLAPSAGF